MSASVKTSFLLNVILCLARNKKRYKKVKNPRPPINSMLGKQLQKPVNSSSMNITHTQLNSIQRPVDIKSNVEEKTLKIPDFLKK